MAAAGGREDPLTAFRFVVECDNIAVGFFTECTGLKAEVEVFEYQEGGLNDYVHKLPGRRKWTNITLQHGITSSLDMWDWYQDVADHNVDHRLNLSIILCAPDGTRIMQWDVYDAYPVSWEGPSMKSDGSTVVVEKLELAHNGFDVLNP